METAMLTGKFLIMLALEAIVAVLVLGVLVAGVYQIVRDKVRQARHIDEVAPAARPVRSRASVSGARPAER
jgi:hypothetical protein